MIHHLFKAGAQLHNHAMKHTAKHATKNAANAAPKIVNATSGVWAQSGKLSHRHVWRILKGR